MITDKDTKFQEHVNNRAPAKAYEDYDHATEQEHQTAEQKHWSRTNVISWFTLGFTVIAAVSAAGAFLQTRRQADSAEKQLTLSREQEVSQLRAYVGPVGGIIENFDGSVPKISIQLKNFGSTPASRVRVITYDEIILHSDLDNWRAGEQWRRSRIKTHPIGVLDPGQPIPAEIQLGVISSQAKDNINAASHILVVKMIACYGDIFGGEHKRMVSYYLPTPINIQKGEAPLRLLWSG